MAGSLKYQVIIIFILLYSILVYAKEECKYDSIKVIGGVNAKKTSCGLIETTQGDILKLNFTICEEIKLINWDNFVKNNDIPLTNYEKRNVKVPNVDINGGIATFNRDNKFIAITYIPYFKCSASGFKDDFFPQIKILPPNENSIPEPPQCASDDWICFDWEPKVCPESEKQKRNCRRINTDCLNPEAIKPFETRNCTYIPTKTPPIVPPTPLIDIWRIIEIGSQVITIVGTIIMIYLMINYRKKSKNDTTRNLIQSARQNLTPSEKMQILERQKLRCKECKVVFKGKIIRPHYDHINPIFRGGEKGKDLKNIQALCPNCHDAKTRKERKKMTVVPKVKYTSRLMNKSGVMVIPPSPLSICLTKLSTNG